MSEAFDKFLAGEDRLAALLCALPVYAPPASLEENFLAAAQAAQLAHGVGASEAGDLNPGQRAHAIASFAGSYQSQATHPGFEPPASLETSFLKMAASIDAAQALRREAVLEQIAKGDSPETAIDADLQPSTIEWLKTQAEQTTGSMPTKTKRSAFRSPFGLSLRDLGLASTAAIVAAVGTLMWLPQQTTQITSVALAPSQESTAPAATTVTAQAQSADKAAAPARPGLRRETERYKDTTRDMTRAPLARSVANTSALPAEANEAKKAFAGEPVEARTAGITAQLAENRQLAKAEMPVPAAPAPAPAPAPTPAPALAPAAAPRIILAEPATPARKEIAAADTDRELPHAFLAAKPMLRPSMPAPAAAPAPAAPSGRSSSAPLPFFSLADDPQQIAPLISGMLLGKPWRINIAQPDRPEVRDWIERLRLSMPEARRPASIALHDEPGMPPQLMRVEQIAGNPDSH